VTLLAAREPFEAAPVLRHLAARAVPGVEEVAGGEYRAAVRLAHGVAVIGLAPADGGVRLGLIGANPRDRDEAGARAAAAFDLDRDPASILAALADAALVGPLVRAAPGRRVPVALDGAEFAVRAVIGQQVSLAGAATVAGRLVREHGEPLATPVGSLTHAFPAPAELAAADPETLPMPRARARAVVAVAAALASGALDVRPGADPEAAEAALLAMPGVGPWTAAMIRLRALGDRDAFPASDLGIRRALERLGADASPRGALRLAEGWRPLRAYAAQHLWASG
jgi:AraC family transcriptional regulator, regulatory protein of adaptative response / DNA-3-methyladenine glycosylase II